MKSEILKLQKLKNLLGPKGWIEDKEVIEKALNKEWTNLEENHLYY